MSDLGTTRLADLWTRHLAGEPLASEEYDRLSEAFTGDEVFRRRVLHDRRLDSALKATAELDQREPELLATMNQLLKAAAHSEDFVDQLRLRLAAEPAARRVASRRVLMAGVAAAAVVGAFFALPRRTSRPTASRTTTLPAAAARMSTPAATDRVVVPPAAKTAVLLLGGDASPAVRAPRKGSGDGLLRDHLEELGYAVQLLDADNNDPTLLRNLEHAQVVVLSPSITAGELSDELANAAVPMVALETSAFLRLGMTGGTWMRDIGGNPSRATEIVVAAPDHPLAAGLRGALTVLQSRQIVRWGSPGDDATIVARYPGAPAGQSAIFAYDRGADMPGGRAAARRVGMFLGNNRVIGALTGEGWRLFDAAVTWCAADRR
jgi:hypothetical protein